VLLLSCAVGVEVASGVVVLLSSFLNQTLAVHAKRDAVSEERS
jgi:hypothetical protein